MEEIEMKEMVNVLFDALEGVFRLWYVFLG